MSEGHVSCLTRVSRTVSDLVRLSTFYRDALDFEMVSEAAFEGAPWDALVGRAGIRGRSMLLRLGQQELELVAFLPPGRLYPPKSSSVDLWFQHIAIVVSDMDAAYARLGRYAVSPISRQGPQRLPASSGSATAYKFRDLDGHPLELIQFPPGTGAGAWQHTDRLFLGIDHSAIDVADIAQSIDFYTRLLGLRVSSRSVNSGPEQERLDGVRKDFVHVVALQPVVAGPPHVELLGYAPPAARPVPARTAANDVYADRLVLEVDGLEPLIETLRTAEVPLVSSPVATRDGATQTALVHDPTGHLLLLCANTALAKRPQMGNPFAPA